MKTNTGSTASIAYMGQEYDKPKYALLIEILDEAARPHRVRRCYPSGYGIDISDIDIEWLYQKLTEIGADLKKS